jgi:hypothetical protein
MSRQLACHSRRELGELREVQPLLVGRRKRIDSGRCQFADQLRRNAELGQYPFEEDRVPFSHLDCRVRQHHLGVDPRLH